MSYNAVDVANFIVNYCIDKDQPIGNLKLQKLLYYTQAAFLIEKDEPAFDNEISAWKFGPVVDHVYRNFKRYVDRDINERVDYKLGGIFGEKVVSYNPADVIDATQDQAIIKRVVDSYMNYASSELVSKSHDEEPWKSVFKHDIMDIKISNASIKEYFIAHEDKLYGNK